MAARFFARSIPTVALLFVLLIGTAHAQEPVDREAVTVIRRHGLEQSQVMETLSWLTDVHGPRLTGSPQLMNASKWAVSQLSAWGLRNARLEPWGPFGRGWTLERFSMNVVAPVPFPIVGYPQAWSPDIKAATADVVLFDAASEEDFARFRGKLGGKIVFVDELQPITESFEPRARRRTPEDLLKLANASPSGRAGERTYSEEVLKRYRLRQARFRFVVDEKPLAIVDRATSKGGYGTMYVAAASVPTPADATWDTRPGPWDLDQKVIPQITIAEEQYNRIVRLLKKGMPVRIETMLDATYIDDDPMEYNVIADIPGTDPVVGEEIVMVGAHLDSWHAGTGAQDNAAGVAVMMEAVRILQETFREMGRQPRRTIRIALWTGEEQGLFGSRAYVSSHLADVTGFGSAPSALKPDHARFSAYYNLDNGAGKIRGVYLQGNEAVRPIFRAWLDPFTDLDTGTLSSQNTGGTDHLSFDAVGLPGFQFIQDPLSYGQVYHSNFDTYDHVIPDDLKQAATIIASFVYHTSQRDEKLPRKVVPVPGATGTR